MDRGWMQIISQEKAWKSMDREWTQTIAWKNGDTGSIVHYFHGFPLEFSIIRASSNDYPLFSIDFPSSVYIE